MNADPLRVQSRVSYHEGMLLDASDFTNEQQYHRGRLAIVLARLHGSGTVAGLKVEGIKKGDPVPGGKTAEEDHLGVLPGIAVDRMGRLVEIPAARCLRLDRWFNAVATAGSNVLKPLTVGTQRWLVADVFLRYLECPNGLRPSFPSAGQDATDAVVAARVQDGFELVLAPRSSETAGVPPPLPRQPSQPAPTTRKELLAAIYAGYQPATGPEEYPVAPMDDTPAGTPIKKLADKSAVFLARVLIRLEDIPATALRRHATGAFKVEDESRLVLPAAELLLSLTNLA